MTEPSTPPFEPISDDERARVHKRTLFVVIACQILGGAGLAAGVSVGALLANQMLHDDSLTGVPIGLLTLGSAMAAYVVGRSTQKYGRRLGLASGFIVGAVAAVGVVIAAMTSNVALLFISLFLYGAGTATNLQARYAATDLALPHRRGFGTSMAMVATTVGAVAGPNLIGPMGRVSQSIGAPVLAGPFILAAAAFGAAGIVMFLFLRPDPFLLARRLAEQAPATGSATPKPTGHINMSAYVAGTVMVITQIVMVGIMTMTPIHMRTHHFELEAVGLVISLHVAAMWLPSLVTGVLVDTWGRMPVVILAGLTLLAAGVTAALAPNDSFALMALALVLLGMGWNFGLVSGTALVVDTTAPADRPRVQGTVDVLVALAGAASGLMSGMVMSASSYAAMSLGGGLLALILIPVLMWSRSHQKQVAAA